MTPDQKEAFRRLNNALVDGLIPYPFDRHVRSVLDALAATHPAPAADTGQELEPDAYDAGLLNDFGGGDVSWWQDYIRDELARAHEFYASQWPAADTGQAVGFCKPELIEKLRAGKAANGADISCMKGNAYTVPLYTHPASLDAERVRELETYRSAAKYDAMMEGPTFKGWDLSRLERARRMTRAALRQSEGG